MIPVIQEKRNGSMKPGQDIVVAGYVGLSGTAVIADQMEDELLKHFTGQFVSRCNYILNAAVIEEAGFFDESGAAEYEPLSEGGIMKALWNLFHAYGLGFEIELRAIPILQETVEVCEIFDINPYRLQSEGCVILTADNGGDLVRYLGMKGIHGAVIGKTAKGIKRQIMNGETHSFLDRPKPDELIKILR